MPIGFGQLSIDIGSFVEDEPRALFERLGKKIEYAVEGRHRTRGDDVRLLEDGSCLGARSHNAHVSELERFDSAIHKAGFLLSGLGKREADIGQHDGKWNAGEAGSGTCVEHSRGLRKMAPRRDRVAHMLDSGFFGTGEPREIHVFVGGDDELKMLRGLCDQPFAMWNFRRKNAIKFFFILHTFIMALRATRR
jgi:hypothetical protein